MGGHQGQPQASLAKRHTAAQGSEVSEGPSRTPQPRDSGLADSMGPKVQPLGQVWGEGGASGLNALLLSPDTPRFLRPGCYLVYRPARLSKDEGPLLSPAG